MLSYPQDLPLFDLGWTAGPRSNLLVSSPERGPGKRRRLTTAAVDELSGDCSMTSSQLSAFQAFWEAINGGADAFLYPDFTDSGDLRAARFAEMYKATRTGIDSYRVTITLELLP